MAAKKRGSSKAKTKRSTTKKATVKRSASNVAHMTHHKSAKKSNKEGKLFVGCLFIGLGLGMLMGRPDVGVLVGMGVGFLGMYSVRR